MKEVVNSVEFNSKQWKWVKKDIPRNESKFQWAGETPAFRATEWSLLGLFELFFDENVLNLMCEHSVTYASQKGNHGFTIAPNEMKTFLGIILLSGYCVLPRKRMYWEQADDVGNASVTCAMSRNRFEEILQFLHLSDNMHLATNDKLGKADRYCCTECVAAVQTVPSSKRSTSGSAALSKRNMSYLPATSHHREEHFIIVVASRSVRPTRQAGYTL